MFIRWRCVLLTLLIAVTPAWAQEYPNEGDRCQEITTMSNDVFGLVIDANKARIKAFIRPSAKLFKADCLRTIVTRLGGFRHLMSFLNGSGSLWTRLPDIGALLCNAVIENLPDNWNGDAGAPVPLIDILSAPAVAPSRQRMAIVRGVA